MVFLVLPIFLFIFFFFCIFAHNEISVQIHSVAARRSVCSLPLFLASDSLFYLVEIHKKYYVNNVHNKSFVRIYLHWKWKIQTINSCLFCFSLCVLMRARVRSSAVQKNALSTVENGYKPNRRECTSTCRLQLASVCSVESLRTLHMNDTHAVCCAGAATVSSKRTCVYSGTPCASIDDRSHWASRLPVQPQR